MASTGNGKRLEVRPVVAGFGAEILGLDLASDVADETFEELRRVFGEYGVIFFRGPAPDTPEQHTRFRRALRARST